ncbi:MAG: 4Fe-4S binding protein [Acidobacteria bacterium]|nr:MAG: 4Fe-4S binding protein [Acidobacteriota bacterium]
MVERTDLRLKILRLLRRQPHRYDRRRLLGMGVSLGVLFAVPLLGLARVDLWRGRHLLLGAPAPFKHALAGVIVGIAATYVATFLVNLAGGRLFCGWGCPVGQLSRFAEALDGPGLSRRQRLAAHLRGGSFSAALSLSILAWWVDLRVLWQGSPAALASAWGVLAGAVALAWAHGRFWRWDFCAGACPIGLYYSLVSPARWFGVHFRDQLATCLDCDACDNVCPVGLAPRSLMDPTGPRPGLAVDGAPGRNHCLECGDCVRACEWMIARRGREPVPLRLGFFAGPQRLPAPPEARPAPQPALRKAG